jgi:peroxiredoxin Q/BCP
VRILWTVLLGLALLPAAALGGEEEHVTIEVGDAAPAFRLNGEDGKAVSLAEARKEAWVVLAFFPKADTPG